MRTIDDIIPPSKRAASEAPAPAPKAKRPRGKFPTTTLIIVLIIIAAAVGALYYFGSASVKVTPTSQSVTVTGSYTATSGTGELPFQIITSQKVATQSVPSNGVRSTSSSASGQVTISNASKASQPLRATTRFQSPTGLIYRIHTAVVVPAAKGTVPGTLSATVYADKPGSEYNIAPSSFTLPGFQGTAEYKVITAKSSSAFTGGGAGNEPIVQADVEASTRTALKDALAPELVAEMQKQVPNGYILLTGAATTTFEALPSTASATDKMADLKEQGTIRAVVFPNEALARAVARNTLTGSYQNEAMLIAPSSTVTLAASTLPGTTDNTFTFGLSGSAKLVYQVDKTRIAAAVAGKSRDDAETALRNYPEVNQAVLLLRPFWRTSFPEDPTQTSVSIVAQN